MYAVIEPVPVFPSTAHVLTLDNVLVMPGSSARYWWRLRVDQGSPELTSGMGALIGDAYSAWGTDDEYLYRYAAEALGLTITEIVPDAVAASPVASPAPEAPDFTIPEAPLDVSVPHVEEPAPAAPVAPPVVEEPVAPPVVEEPVVAPVVVEEPVAPVAVEEPVVAPVVEEPVVAPLEADPAAGSI